MTQPLGTWLMASGSPLRGEHDIKVLQGIKTYQSVCYGDHKNRPECLGVDITALCPWLAVLEREPPMTKLPNHSSSARPAPFTPINVFPKFQALSVLAIAVAAFAKIFMLSIMPSYKIWPPFVGVSFILTPGNKPDSMIYFKVVLTWFSIGSSFWWLCRPHQDLYFSSPLSTEGA
jgi:hypothetical protein